MSRHEGPFVLDTHVWVWLTTGHASLQGSRSLKLVLDAVKRSQVMVCPISVWEVGMLEAKRRLRFSMPCLEWVRSALAPLGLILADFSLEMAIEASRLPGEFHGDPADRMIVATARQMNATLITEDGKILDYANAGFLNALRASGSL